MTGKIDINALAQLVDKGGKPTPQTTVTLQEIAKMLRDHEARIAALEP